MQDYGRRLYELVLFAGVGAGVLGTKYCLGWETIGYVEFAEYPIKVLQARIRDGYLDDAPIWGNIRTFTRANPECSQFIRRLAGLNNLVITAGFPCQPFSGAGRRKGKDDTRNMWPDTIRVIREIRPKFVFLENVRGLLSAKQKFCIECGKGLGDSSDDTFRYFGRVLADLAESGYNARWRVLSAAEVGAFHKRERVWISASLSDSKGSNARRTSPNNK
jgi:DNA (cytosine-5)-methyltransferase 1